MTASVICGLHAVKSAIEAAPAAVIRLLLDRKRHDRRMQSIIDLAKKHSVNYEFVARDELESRAEGQVHQGVVLLTRANRSHDEKDIDALLDTARQPPLVLALDSVTDPHNLGACLRTADAAGVDFVIVPKDRAAGPL